LGIPAQIEEVVTSAKLTADYLRGKPGFGSLYVIGEEELRKELHSAGLTMTNGADADTVLVSFDTTLTYEKLMTGYRALKNGARFIATNPDAVCPSPDGGLVDAGAIIAALEASTGRKLELVIGKPSRILAEMLAEQLKVLPAYCMVVGDRLNTDMRLGKQGGMRTAWISPSSNGESVSEDQRPDYILTSIQELPSVLQDME
jgi:NagD protein